ncbi:hypothetical protein NM208_g13218 [Fusarium decemcellulare]|uniref:Uncharacterized protein n=1 Tax=Fusarium decemcellulare TaxID=57161 RepID=A0ACC1RP72_9HYPO|nr:hypothetical protein NM208_g13218 [Fusarium decemcellulare]
MGIGLTDSEVNLITDYRKLVQKHGADQVRYVMWPQGGNARRLKQRREHGVRVDFREMIKRHRQVGSSPDDATPMEDADDNGRNVEGTSDHVVVSSEQAHDPSVVQQMDAETTVQPTNPQSSENGKPYGYIHRCVVCNDSRHETHECPSFNEEGLMVQLKIPVHGRANLPALTNMDWYNKWLYGLMADELRTPLPGLPWTAEFARKAMETLGGKDAILTNLRTSDVSKRLKD